MPTDEEAHGAMARLSELLSLPENWSNDQETPDLAIDDTEQYQIAQLWNSESDAMVEVWLLGPDRVQPHFDIPVSADTTTVGNDWGDVYSLQEIAEYLNDELPRLS
jgi:hypothetical protein